MYHDGIGVKPNYYDAMKWFRRAADYGSARAQHSLGLMYSNGEGVPQNYQEAMYWYHKAAVQGHIRSINNLGVMYLNGNGVPQNFIVAYAYFEIVAASNDMETKPAASHNQEEFAKLMTPDQIAKAIALSANWKPGMPLPEDKSRQIIQ